MEQHFGTLVDYEFTAELEDFPRLDQPRRGGPRGVFEEVLFRRRFRKTNTTSACTRRLATKLDEIDPKETARFLLGTPE